MQAKSRIDRLERHLAPSGKKLAAVVSNGNSEAEIDAVLADSGFDRSHPTSLVIVINKFGADAQSAPETVRQLPELLYIKEMQ